MNTPNLLYVTMTAVASAWLVPGCMATNSAQTGAIPAAAPSGTALTAPDTGSAAFDPSYAPQTFPYARASITITGTPGGLSFPESGQMRVLAYSWGGSRPRIVPQEADSLGTIIELPGGTPTLNIQKREDNASPLLAQLFEQQIPIDLLTFIVDPETAPATTYNLYDVRIASMRTVGPQTSPLTEELVLVFSRIEQLVFGQ